MNYVRFKHKFLLHGKGKPKPKLSVGRYYLAATTIGDYALFGGGYGGGYRKTVDAYDENMTLTNPTELKDGRYEFAAASNGYYALFGGGRGGSTLYDTVDAYNTSLTRSTPTGFGTDYRRYNLAAARAGIMAVFAGGYDSTSMSSKVQAYDGYLNQYTASSLGGNTAKLASASNGEYAVFAGGVNLSDTEVASKVMCRYAADLTKTTSSSLSVAREQLAATNVGDYVLFGGGRGNGTIYGTVDAFSRSFTRISATGLSKSRMNLTATSIGYKAFFGGGEVNGTKHDVVDCYDASLTHTIEKPLSVARYGLASTAIGGKAIFAGGYGTNPSYSDAVDVCEDTRKDITVNLVVLKSTGRWIYTKQHVTISVQAKEGMTYRDLTFALNSTIELPEGEGNTVTLSTYTNSNTGKTHCALKYKTPTSSKMATLYSNPLADTLLEDGMTIELTGSMYTNTDTDFWIISISS